MSKVLLLILVLMLCGCATMVSSSTWKGVNPGDPDRAEIRHTWFVKWFPALFPMPFRWKDGERELETKSIEAPDIIIPGLGNRN